MLIKEKARARQSALNFCTELLMWATNAKDVYEIREHKHILCSSTMDISGFTNIQVVVNMNREKNFSIIIIRHLMNCLLALFRKSAQTSIYT